MSLYKMNVKLETGAAYSLDCYQGKVMLIVNTASKCGLTPQFDELEALYKKYKDDGFVVLGFPSNQFKQEVATAEQAASNCRLTYGVTFPMHEIVKVNGKDAHPLFDYLTSETKGILGKSIKWNFTKFLINRDGTIIKRFAPTDKPSNIENYIQEFL